MGMGEEGDAGYSFGSCFDALNGVKFGDPSQGDYWYLAPGGDFA
jgi:hypothetical protein